MLPINGCGEQGSCTNLRFVVSAVRSSGQPEEELSRFSVALAKFDDASGLSADDWDDAPFLPEIDHRRVTNAWAAGVTTPPSGGDKLALIIRCDNRLDMGNCLLEYGIAYNRNPQSPTALNLPTVGGTGPTTADQELEQFDGTACSDSPQEVTDMPQFRLLRDGETAIVPLLECSDGMGCLATFSARAQGVVLPASAVPAGD